MASFAPRREAQDTLHRLVLELLCSVHGAWQAGWGDSPGDATRSVGRYDTPGRIVEVRDVVTFVRDAVLYSLLVGCRVVYLFFPSGRGAAHTDTCQRVFSTASSSRYEFCVSDTSRADMQF